MLAINSVCRIAAWGTGALLLFGSTVVAPAGAAMPARDAAVVAASSKTPSDNALSSLLPNGGTGCGQQPASNLPPGLTGLTLSYSCDLPKLGKTAFAYAFAFDNASDYAKSLATFNTYKTIAPSVAGNRCPVKITTDFGIVPWRSSNYPARAGQDLECLLFLTTGAGTETTADYIWTIPSKNAIVEAEAHNLAMPRLDAWWKANAVKHATTSLVAVSGRQHASILVNAYPLGVTECGREAQSNLPTGMVGVVQDNNCSVPKLGPQSYFNAYVFDNTQDYLTSLVALNTYKGIDPTSSDNECPMASGFSDGVTQWHNSSFPVRSGQDLECTLAAVKVGAPNNIPDYIWTVPSENVILEAYGDPGATMQSLDTWWTHNSDT
jgi:hypothetical protein